MELSFKSREKAGLLIGIFTIVISLSPYPFFLLGLVFLSFVIGYELSRALDFTYFYFAPLTLFASLVSTELGLLLAFLLSLYSGWRFWSLQSMLKSLLLSSYGGLLPSFLSNLKSMDSYAVIKLLIFVWAVDIFSYYVGKSFGKTPLAPRLSPKKTWEGLLGGAIAGTLALLILHGFLKGLLWSPLLITAALFGDLFKSFIKRQVGIKDFSHVLGEHGGFTDRFDSLLFTAPVYIFLLKF
ncbi:MAG: phosphatidate cytidylyltransferase [Acidobacteria bacterium]|nr:MAG: phosphatidate cytidylyltransferase [Acidobacteriota bacterium]